MVFIVKIFLFLLFFGNGILLEAFPRFIAETEYLNVLGRQDILNWRFLFELSLSASGVVASERKIYQAKLERYVSDLKVLLKPLDNDYEKGEAILRYIYQFLTKYEALQTRMDIMFQNGVYNCVSSGILYASLARAFGLDVKGVGTYDHAFVTLALADGRHIDIETTSEYGFDPGQKKEFLDVFTSQTGLVYVPKKKYAKRESLSDLEFVSLILQNRLYILNQNNKSFRILEQMIPLAADLATLSQKDENIQNFFSMVSQYSFRLSQMGKTKEAILFTDLVLQNYGKRDILIDVRNIIAHNNIVELIGNKKYKEAEQRLFSYKSSNILSTENYQKLARSFKGKRLEELVNSSKVEFNKKLKAVENIAQDNIFSKREVMNFYQMIYGNKIQSLLKRNQFKEAMALLDSYPKMFRNESSYRNMESIIQDSYTVNVYNKAVVKINKGAYQEAKNIIAKGLSFYPKNVRLQKLRSKLSQFLSNSMG